MINNTNIEEELSEYKAFLMLEKGLSANTIESYIHDIGLFTEFIQLNTLTFTEVNSGDIISFTKSIHDSGRSRTSQARIISGVKSFYNYLVLYDRISVSPLELVAPPKIKRKLPDILSIKEVNSLLESIDLSSKLGARNRAMIEMLYSCGVRVSELISIKCNDLFFSDGYLRVRGKGNKQRLIPVNTQLVSDVENYLLTRPTLQGKHTTEDTLFLSQRGSALTRVMVFTIIKQLCLKSGINKSVSPHTFRHTFATHLIKGGMDIRALQDILGHESIITTEIYTHLDREHHHKIIDTFHPLSKSK